jgi:EAL domain-containing protein (putative c-di-GMP-specific phosphodiesterase class I)
MQVMVEGVETAKQVAVVADAHADQMQGFFFSEPISPIWSDAMVKRLEWPRAGRHGQIGPDQ